MSLHFFFAVVYFGSILLLMRDIRYYVHAISKGIPYDPPTCLQEERDVALALIMYAFTTLALIEGPLEAARLTDEAMARCLEATEEATVNATLN